MIKVLLLGYSHIAQKSVLPVLRKHPKFKLLAIASQSKAHLIPREFVGFSNYKEAIEKVDFDVVYISLANSSHYPWIKYCLNRGKSVICDKPVVLSRKEAFGIYKEVGRGQIIFEATAHLYHSEHKKISELIDKNSLYKINVLFGFPQLPKGNFRNKKSLGGGCIFDLGPYVVSAGEHYFGRKALSVSCQTYSEKGLPKTASVILNFGENKVLCASIGFGLEYVNNLELWGENFHISLDRAFTIPVDLKNTIRFKSGDKVKKIVVGASDSFYEMFDYFSDLDKSEYATYNKKLLARLIMLDALNTASNKGFTKIKYD